MRSVALRDMVDDTADILGGPLTLPHQKSSRSWTFRRLWTLLLLYLILVALISAAIVRVRRIIDRWRWKLRMQVQSSAGTLNSDERAFNVLAAAAGGRADREETKRDSTVIDDSDDEAERVRTVPSNRAPQSRDTTGYRVPPAYNNASIQLAGVVHTSTSGYPIQQGYEKYQLNCAPALLNSSPAHHYSYEPTPGRFGQRIPPPDVYQAQESNRDQATCSSGGSRDYEYLNAQHGPHVPNHRTSYPSRSILRHTQDPAAGTSEQGRSINGHGADDDDMDVHEPKVVETTKRGLKRSVYHDSHNPASDRADGRHKRIRIFEHPEAKRSKATSARRGRKRDRAEAGLTDDNDESDVDEGASNGKSHRLRKRRATSQGNLESPSRGRKRDREACEESKSDRPKKRSKQSVDAQLVLIDPSCEERHIGEEWEENGIHFKVGPNRHRLRLVLLKKTFLKYVMPDDSQHPDRYATIDMYFEKWLEEEEFRIAQEQGMVVSPLGSVAQLDTSLEHGDPHAGGKSLLWRKRKRTSTALESSGPKSSMSEHSTTSRTGPRVNPFLRPPPRRPISAFQAMRAKPSSLHLPLPSSNLPTWEKEEREAASYARLREWAARNGLNGQSSPPTPAPALVARTQTVATPEASQVPSIPSSSDRPAEKPAQQPSGQPAAHPSSGFPSMPAASPLTDAPKSPKAPAPAAMPLPVSEAPKSMPLFISPAPPAPTPSASSPAPAPSASSPAPFSPAPTLAPAPTPAATEMLIDSPNNTFVTPPASDWSSGQPSHHPFIPQGMQQSAQITSTMLPSAPAHSSLLRFGSAPAAVAPKAPMFSSGQHGRPKRPPKRRATAYLVRSDQSGQRPPAAQQSAAGTPFEFTFQFGLQPGSTQ